MFEQIKFIRGDRVRLVNRVRDSSRGGDDRGHLLPARQLFFNVFDEKNLTVKKRDPLVEQVQSSRFGRETECRIMIEVRRFCKRHNRCNYDPS